jgi:shikimate kinase
MNGADIEQFPHLVLSQIEVRTRENSRRQDFAPEVAPVTFVRLAWQYKIAMAGAFSRVSHPQAVDRMSDESNRPRRIVLVGLSGTGKSTVGRLVARRLGWMSGDTDDQIVALDGRDIPQIFRDESEDYFRKVERKAVSQLSKGDNWVIATGAGAVLDPVNRERLWRGTFVVYLETDVKTLHDRIAHGNPHRAARPLLAGDDPLARLAQLHQQRAPLYQLADWCIQTDHLTKQQVAEAIVVAWRDRSAALLSDPNRLDRVSAANTTGPRP